VQTGLSANWKDLPKYKSVISDTIIWGSERNCEYILKKAPEDEKQKETEASLNNRPGNSTVQTVHSYFSPAVIFRFKYPLFLILEHGKNRWLKKRAIVINGVLIIKDLSSK
jgi:hypothetical protein